MRQINALNPLLLLVLAMLAAPVAAQSGGTPLPASPHVVVSGDAKVNAAPDMVLIRLAVEANNSSPGRAKSQVDEAVNRYLDVLKRHGVPTTEVTASQLTLNEDFDYDSRDRRVSRGHLAERTVSARVQSVESFNAIIDEGLAAGMTSIEGVTFQSSQADALRTEARAQAAAVSRERAQELATAFGARLGPVYSINSVGSGIASQYGELDRVTVTGSRRGAPPRQAVYLQPTIEFNERVQVVFELLP